MKKSAISVLLSVFALSANAQSLNPKVQVVNDYEVKVEQVKKSGVEMAVPDSLLRFDYKFDYNVFETGYTGAYDVSQYFIRVTPAPPVPDNRKFYLRMGAGYTLRPEMQLAWQAVSNDAYHLTLSNDLNGFYGPYKRGWQAGTFTGYDIQDDFKLSNRWDFKKALMKLDVGYDGIFTNADDRSSGFNSATASLRVASKSLETSYFDYDFGLNYRYSSDCLGPFGRQSEHLASFAGFLGPVLKEKYSIYIDFALNLDANRGFFQYDRLKMGVTPRVNLLLGPVSLDLGVKLTYISQLSVFPDVKASVSVFKKHLTIFAGITGDDVLGSYSDLKFANHRYDITMGQVKPYKERINLYAGLRGNADKVLQYSLKGGYAAYNGAHLSGIDTLSMRENLTYASYRCAYAEALLGLNSERVEADASFDFKKMWFDEGAACAFTDPLFSLKGRFTYNWLKRIYAGVWCEWRASREAQAGSQHFEVPSWVNLGINLRYRFVDTWAVWLQAGNLLGQDLWFSPGFAQQGRSFTAGFTCSF